eukprot:CAMPEP_0179414062 /NCGR_PEP_ID=MMETSP0799-20121207/5449_1 /TAXON_ID=46947 /ORGANISM="Geminigera cryophila, Strain CCMP2564" /LENGTH=496 /DNA_ID=CAMNT_0021186611 /DNA_START=85 /DNA_END=1575 /DNA_ORIENTATION=-
MFALSDKPALLCVFADYFGLSVLQPTLPFFIEEIDPNTDKLELWTGAILSAQFIAVIPGNLFWGYLTDRLGSRLTLQITIAGDALCFLGTAFCKDALSLLFVRACAGFFSPLVPALANIFEIVPAKDAVAAMGRFGMCVMGAYIVGSGLVGVVYESIHWSGVNFVTTAVAVLAIVPISLTALPPKIDRPPATGVLAAIKSADFMTHAATGCASGFMMNAVVSVATIVYKDIFGLSVTQVGFIFLGLPFLLMVVATVIVPNLVKHYLGMQKTITLATCVVVVAAALLSVPQIGYSSVYTFSVFIAILIMMQTAQHQPNQVRVKLISGYYTTNGSGIVTGASRIFWALGQGLAPLICLALYASVATWLPWLLISIIMLLLLLFYRVQGVSLTSDPPHLPMTLLAPTTTIGEETAVPEDRLEEGVVVVEQEGVGGVGVGEEDVCVDGPVADEGGVMGAGQYRGDIQQGEEERLEGKGGKGGAEAVLGYSDIPGNPPTPY